MKSQGKPGLNMRPATAEPTSVDPTQEALDALKGATGMTRTDTGYQQAIQIHRPRDIQKVRDAVCREAAMMGEDFIYSWRVRTNDPDMDEGDGKTTIEGMSIEGAMVLARNYGNCAIPTKIEQETPTHFVIRAEFIDLETGFNYPRMFRQRKTVKMGKMDADRAEDIAFQIAQSKAQRNVIDKALGGLRDQAIEAAKTEAAKKYTPVEKHLPDFLEHARKLGVSQAQLEARMGHKIAAWDPYTLVALRAVYKSIARGESSTAAEFPPEETPAAAAGGGPTGASGPAAEGTPEIVPATLYSMEGVLIPFPEGIDPKMPVPDLVRDLNARGIAEAWPYKHEAAGARGGIRQVKKTPDELESDAAERALGTPKDQPAATKAAAPAGPPASERAAPAQQAGFAVPAHAGKKGAG